MKFQGARGWCELSVVGLLIAYPSMRLAPAEKSSDWPQFRGPGGQGADRLTRITELKNPGSTYIMVEENDNRDYNMDAWAFDPYKFILIDTIAVFHNNITMFGYADGHSDGEPFMLQPFVAVPPAQL